MTIGILTPANPSFAKTEHQLKYMLLMEGESAYSVNPTKARMSVDCLVLLDTEGLNCNVGYCLAQDACPLPPHYPGQDQWYEFFRVHNFEWHLRKKTPIVAFGSSALMLWGALGGKLQYNDGQLVPAMDHKMAEFGGLKSIGITDFPACTTDFVCGLCVGLEQMPIELDVYRIIRRLVKLKLDQDSAKITAPTTTTPPSISDKYVEPIPEEVEEGLKSIEIPAV